MLQQAKALVLVQSDIEQIFPSLSKQQEKSTEVSHFLLPEKEKFISIGFGPDLYLIFVIYSNYLVYKTDIAFIL
jgi:hypothetical protein